jgi:hypothetical protein
MGWFAKPIRQWIHLPMASVNCRAASGAASKGLKEKPHAASREESDPTRLERSENELEPSSRFCVWLGAA